MIRNARLVYLVAVALFALGVIVQLFPIGLIVVAGRIGFDLHRELGHLLAVPVLVMVVTAHLGRSRAAVIGPTWLLLAALHPVLALADIVLAQVLLQRGWSALRAGWSDRSVAGDVVAMPRAVSR